jgi:hypothetical protein
MSSHAPSIIHGTWPCLLHVRQGLRWSPGVCEWSSRSLRSILAHAATAPMSARAGRLPSPWVENQKAHDSTRKHDHHMLCRRRSECDSAMSMCRGRAHHIPASASTVLAYLALFYFAPYYCEARPSALALHLSACLFTYLPSGLCPFSCVPPLSALCSALPCCTRAHTGLASSGRARCRRWRCP